MIEITEAEYKKRMKLVTEGVANDLRNELLKRVPVDTSALKTSIKVKPDGKGYIISMLNYGLYVEFGRPPYIGRKDGKSKYKNGKYVKVGQRPNPFIRSTIHLKLKQILSDNIRRHFT